uniref:Chemokine interleukin-8-like domain-containing protein n=1 Tax=Malurus cyaneus samueli TaxID=2593467 RepID=A0A8C5T863_9PASS
MRVLAASLTVLLLVTISSVSVGSHWAHLSAFTETIPACCFTYVSHPIPFRTILSAYRTSNTCQQPAVVLVTKRRREICADPEAPWVQEYLKRLELSV